MIHLKISELINFLLFDEIHGYYKTQLPLGKNADFITAPEISQLFGELVAIYLLQIFSIKKPNLSLVEMGAGRGFWMSDILRTIQKLAARNQPLALEFISKSTIHIIEINPHLREIQKQKLQDFAINFQITWHETFEEFLTAQKGEIYFISNELFDCFSIDQFVKTKLGWCERLVELEDDFRVTKNFSQKIHFSSRDFDQKIHQFVEEKLGWALSNTAPIQAIFEFSKTAENFMKKLCASLAAHGGIAINFDYGYFVYDFANNLQAVKNHHKIKIESSIIQDLLACDITAHVDFQFLRRIAKEFKLETSETTQSNFLRSLEIEKRTKELATQNPNFAKQIQGEMQRLIGNKEGEMGDLFKCQIIWR